MPDVMNALKIIVICMVYLKCLDKLKSEFFIWKQRNKCS